MVTLSNKGLARLREFVMENGTQRVREAYDYEGELAWINNIDDAGHLEMSGQYTANGRPCTISFPPDEVATT